MTWRDRDAELLRLRRERELRFVAQSAVAWFVIAALLGAIRWAT